MSFHQSVGTDKSGFRKSLQNKFCLVILEGVRENFGGDFVITQQDMVIGKALGVVSINLGSQI